MAYELRESGNASANVDGKAMVTLQPLRAFEHWHVTRITVQSTSQTLVPTCRVYRGSESESNFIGGTYTGTLDSSDESLDIANGEALLFVWEGADVGANCIATVIGKSRRT